MLTDTALKTLKPKSTPYKVTDRDGMYVTVGAHAARSGVANVPTLVANRCRTKAEYEAPMVR